MVDNTLESFKNSLIIIIFEYKNNMNEILIVVSGKCKIISLSSYLSLISINNNNISEQN